MRRLAAVVAVALAAGLTACSGGGGTYEITARFARTVALYDQSDVLVMGAEVGKVTHIEIDGDEVEVTLTIDDDVPLPDDVTAAIMPTSLIGERQVILGPAWRPGDTRLAPGSVLGVDRTVIPVEPDEALQAITDLVLALDPDSVATLVEEAAGALDGNGRRINDTLAQLAGLLPYLAEQDDELLAIADDLRALAAVVEAREAEIESLLADFATVTGVLADERDDIVAFLDALVSITEQGDALLTAYEVTIPEDLETLASVAFTVEANADSVQDAVAALADLGVEVIEAFDPETNSIRARVHTTQSMIAPLLALLDALGLGRPCIPSIDTVCP